MRIDPDQASGGICDRDLNMALKLPASSSRVSPRISTDKNISISSCWFQKVARFLNMAQMVTKRTKIMGSRVIMIFFLWLYR